MPDETKEYTSEELPQNSKVTFNRGDEYVIDLHNRVVGMELVSDHCKGLIYIIFDNYWQKKSFLRQFKMEALKHVKENI